MIMIMLIVVIIIIVITKYEDVGNGNIDDNND